MFSALKVEFQDQWPRFEQREENWVQRDESWVLKAQYQIELRFHARKFVNCFSNFELTNKTNGKYNTILSATRSTRKLCIYVKPISFVLQIIFTKVMGLVKTVGIQKRLMDITNSLKRDFTSSNFVCYHFPWFE